MSEQATQMLEQHLAGDPTAANRLLPLVYTELHAAAGRYLKNERLEHTLQPTALIHEAYLKLIQCDRMDWQGKTHFFAFAARTMRRVLVDHAMARQAQKRGGGQHQRVTLSESINAREHSFDAEGLNEALTRLAKLHERQSQVVELRFFGGMTVEETAQILGVTGRTVKNDWRAARAWLLVELEEDP